MTTTFFVLNSSQPDFKQDFAPQTFEAGLFLLESFKSLEMNE